MPRRSGSRQSIQCYEIVLRGTRRKPLFSTPGDRHALNMIAIRSLRRFDATLHAYCLTPNHFRALLQIKERAIGRALRAVASAYTDHCKRSSNFVDQLFEAPHEARRIDSARDFLKVLRAIHVTPVVARIAVDPADYRWSSHRAYLGYKSVARITTNFAFSLFAKSRVDARAIYRRFIAGEIDIDSIGVDADQRLNVEQTFANAERRIKLAGLRKWRSQNERSLLPRLIQKYRGGPGRRFLSIY